MERSIEHLLIVVSTTALVDSIVDDPPSYLATTLNSYRVFAARPLTVCLKPVDSLVNFQGWNPNLRYFMTYMTTVEGLASAGGLYVIVTLELVTDMNVGGSIAAQHNKL